MAFDSTVGGADANSYASVAEATAYFALRINSAWWALLSNAEQEAYLATATMQLETWVEWNGDRGTTTQALHWPATDATDCVGDDIGEDTIPASVKTAVYEQASYLHGIDATENPVVSQKGIKSASAGPFEVEFDNTYNPERIGKTTQGLIDCYGSLKAGATNGSGGSQEILRA